MCVIGDSLGRDDWVCSNPVDLLSLPERELLHLQANLSQTLVPLNVSLSPLLSICEECRLAFGNRRYNSCKHPQHQGKRSKKNDKLLMFITSPSYFQTYRALNLKCNDGICDKCQPDPSQESSDEEQPSKKKKLEDLNKAIKIVSPSAPPLQFGRRNTAGQAALIKSATTNLQSSILQGFQSDGLSVELQDEQELKQFKTDSSDLAWLMTELKQRIQGCPRAETKSLLTLVPPSWSIKKTSEYFNVSERLVKNSRKRRKETGSILPPIKPKNGRKLSEDTKIAVQAFYYEDGVSRACPGMKDVKSVKNPATGKREQKQKRYLLSNLREVYTSFKHQHPNIKIGLSSFLVLRPPECLSHTSKGFHSVCLCIYHQNAKLLFHAMNIPSMKPYMEAMVCPNGGKDCYFRRCSSCKSSNKIIKKKLLDDSKPLREQPAISYRRWTSTDGTHFTTEQKVTSDFITFAAEELESLLKHHYISKSQQEYLKKLKDRLKPTEIIIWGDFAENFTPVTQDAIQSDFFRPPPQVTIHPFTIYWKEDEEIKFRSISIISNSLTHDTNSFHAFQGLLIPLLISEFRLSPHPIYVQHIHYFSDGCAAQYKNRKNFCNLFYHQEDFKITAEWNFFATAHGKGPCDAQGGTTKRLARAAALRGETIITADELYNWCNNNIQSIKYLKITDEEINQNTEDFNLTARYEELQTIAGTQQGHRLTIEHGKIKMFETSNDLEPIATRAMKMDLPTIHIEECSINDWIGCRYDNNWYLAIIKEVDSENQEIEVNFWKRNTGPKGGTSFIPENSSCFIPIGNVLKKLAPKMSSRRSRYVDVSIEDQEELGRLLAAQTIN